MQKATPTRNVAPMEVPALPNAPGIKGGRECSMCRTDRRMCDGGRPCTRCVTYGFQCRDVRKRGRPKKDQEDKSLVVQDHPLFSEWAIGGGGKKAPEPPRKRRRQSSAKSANTQSVTAPTDKSPKDDLKSAPPKGSVAPSDQLPSLSYASATSISCQYKSPAIHPDESQLRSHSQQQPYYMQQSQQPYSNYPPQQKSYPQPPTPETSESLEQQLQRYRQQYRMHVAGLAEKSSISTELRNLYSHPSQRTDYSTQQQQQQQPPQQQQQQQQQKQKQGYEGTHEQQPAIPFLNCIQELLKITPDMKPSSVMMKEEVVCIDSVQMNPSTKQNNSKSSPISPPQTQHKYPPPQGSPPQYPGLHHPLPPYPPPSHYAPPPSYPSHHQYHPFHRGYSLPPQSLSAYPSHHPYYPPPSGPSLQDEEDDRDSSQSRNDDPRKSYPSFSSERRSAWDFAMPPAAGGDSRARLGGSANATGSSSCPPPSNSTSSLLRLLTYED